MRYIQFQQNAQFTNIQLYYIIYNNIIKLYLRIPNHTILE